MVKLNDAILDNTLVDGYQIRFLVQDLKKSRNKCRISFASFCILFYSYIETLLKHEAIPLSKQEPKISKSNYFKIKFGSS